MGALLAASGVASLQFLPVSSVAKTTKINSHG